MILVSACLVGVRSRYDGTSKESSRVLKMIRGEGAVVVCPEQLGGLPTPRDLSEIDGGDGADILDGKARVINSRGEDVTGYFIRGAYESLRIARLNGVRKAIFKDRSPSCGVIQLQRGETIIRGFGVTTALLVREGITVINEEGEPYLSSGESTGQTGSHGSGQKSKNAGKS